MIFHGYCSECGEKVNYASPCDCAREWCGVGEHQLEESEFDKGARSMLNFLLDDGWLAQEGAANEVRLMRDWRAKK